MEMRITDVVIESGILSDVHCSPGADTEGGMRGMHPPTSI